MTDTVSVNILTLPNDNGAPITDIEYRVNGGTAISLGETTTGSYEIAAELEDEIQIRAVNAIGAGDWSDVKVVFGPVQATGGIETVIEQDGKFYRVHTFLSSGTLTVTQGGEVEYLVVAGGGGVTGRNINIGGGGAGAGGLLKFVSGEAGNTDTDPLQISDGLISIVVGDGGTAGSATSFTDGTSATNGENSVFSSLTAIGGGRGASPFEIDLDPAIGGSGGGNVGLSAGDRPGADGTPPQGNKGGDGFNGVSGSDRRGGGGGGAGTDGSNAASGSPGDGGDGKETAIDGTAKYYAGGGGGAGGGLASSGGLGGGGGNIGGNTAGQSGAPNTGGGAGGSYNVSTGAAGGSGIVIIRYPITEAEYNAEVA